MTKTFLDSKRNMEGEKREQSKQTQNNLYVFFITELRSYQSYQ